MVRADECVSLFAGHVLRVGAGGGSVRSPVQRPTQPLDTKLVKTNRPPGMNTIGMVAWKITMHTPQYPQGRKVAELDSSQAIWYLARFKPMPTAYTIFVTVSHPRTN